MTNGDEIAAGTDPADPCDFDVAGITVAQTGAYLAADCDGDGVSNGDELANGTDPADPCDFDVSLITLPQMGCLLYTSPSPRDKRQSRMPSSA